MSAVNAVISVTSTVPGEIDPWIASVVPQNNITVPALIAYRLPPPIGDADVSSVGAVACISANMPTVDLDGLLDIPIPPRKWVYEAANALGNPAHSQQPNSIIHPTLADVYLPLSAIEAWQGLRTAVEERSAWNNAIKTLETWKNEEGAADALRAIQTIQWGRPTSGLKYDSRSPIGLLAVFLSFQWLAERHIDLIGLCLTSPPDVVVEASLALDVMRLGIEPTMVTPPALVRLQEEHLAGRCNRIFFPTNIDNSHWIAFCVDIPLMSISYGTCTYSSYPCTG
jgi:hypothetical protein